MYSQLPSIALIRSKLRRLILLSTVVLLPCLVAAQSFRGSIRGKVVDPNGNVINGAKIAAKNTATGQYATR